MLRHVAPVTVRGRRVAAAGREDGFTIVELAVAMGIMLLVMLVFLTLVPPSQKSSNVAEALVSNEQDVSLVIARLEKDIRAANPLDAFSSSCPGYTNSVYDDQIEMNLGSTDGTQETVMWVYSPTAETLTREILTATGCTPTVSGTGEVTADILNGSGTPVFSYYSAAGTDLVATSTSQNIANCTVRVGITLVGQGDSNASAFTEQVNVWLRDRLPGGMPGC